MKITNKSMMITLEHDIVIGDLKATLLAMAIGTTECFDLDFNDIENISYREVPIEGYNKWKRFKAFHMEMGIDYDQIIDKEFDKIFTKEAVKKLIIQSKDKNKE